MWERGPLRACSSVWWTLHSNPPGFGAQASEPQAISEREKPAIVTRGRGCACAFSLSVWKKKPAIPDCPSLQSCLASLWSLLLESSGMKLHCGKHRRFIIRNIQLAQSLQGHGTDGTTRPSSACFPEKCLPRLHGCGHPRRSFFQDRCEGEEPGKKLREILWLPGQSPQPSHEEHEESGKLGSGHLKWQHAHRSTSVGAGPEFWHWCIEHCIVALRFPERKISGYLSRGKAAEALPLNVWQ